MEYCTDGWPDKSRLQGVLKHYWADRAVLTVHDGLLLRGTRLVIPSALQGDVLQRLHEGHLGGQSAGAGSNRQYGGQDSAAS